MKINLPLNETQTKILDGLVRLGIYGDSREDVIYFLFVSGIDRMIGVQLVSKHSEMMNALQSAPKPGG